MRLKKKIDVLTDVVGQHYLGCSFDWKELQEYILSFNSVEPNHTLLASNRKKRDGEKYHMTFLNVGEYNKAKKPTIDSIIEIELLGVGKATDDTSVAYYIVCNCLEGQKIRESLELSEKDFHITLGFDPRDVHGVPKKELM